MKFKTVFWRFTFSGMNVVLANLPFEIEYKYKNNKASINQYSNLILSNTKPSQKKNQNFNVFHTNTSIVISSLKVWNCLKKHIKMHLKAPIFQKKSEGAFPRPPCKHHAFGTSHPVDPLDIADQPAKSGTCYQQKPNISTKLPHVATTVPSRSEQSYHLLGTLHPEWLQVANRVSNRRLHLQLLHNGA